MSPQPDKTSIDEPSAPAYRWAIVAALLLAIIYFALAVGWALTGEWILVHIMQMPSPDLAGTEHIQQAKEWVFVIASTILLACALGFYAAWIYRGRGRLEGKLETTEQNYRKVFDRNPLAMWIYEYGSNQILAANKAALQKYGYTEEDYKKMKVIELAGLDEFPRAVKVVTEYTPGLRDTARWTHRRKDGSTFPVEVISDALEYNGKSARIVIATDITEKLRNEQLVVEQQQQLEARVKERAGELFAANEKLKQEIESRRRVEAELTKAKDAAEAASDTKSGFIANTSHEIRTPLTSILGYADLLADPDLSAESRTKFIAVLQQNATHLLRLIDDLLDFSRMEMGRFSTSFEQNSPRELAQRAIDLIKPRAGEKSLHLKLDISENVPATIRTDGARFVQVLLNLLMNAVKFTSQGSVTLRVHAGADASRLLFDVIDTGIGMEPKDTQRIFEPFFQVDNRQKYGGAGLGLAISHQLLTLLGGTIHVESSPGKGSTFTVELPLDPAATPLTNGNGAAPKKDAPLAGHILLADDNAVVRWLVEEYLRRAGATVVGVGDGEAAVAAVKDAMAGRAEKIDLILMDVNMPGMDGSQAMRVIRGLGFKAPIAALTAHSIAVPTQEWMNAGWDAVAGKPIDRNHFIPMVASLIEKGKQPAADPNRN